MLPLEWADTLYSFAVSAPFGEFSPLLEPF